MTVEREPAPEGWEELERVPEIVEKYRGRDPTIFEHEDGDVGVHVVPYEPNEAHGDLHNWRVGIVGGGAHNPTTIETVEEIHGRSDALKRAREVMRELNEVGVEEPAADLATAVQD